MRHSRIRAWCIGLGVAALSVGGAAGTWAWAAGSSATAATTSAAKVSEAPSAAPPPTEAVPTAPEVPLETIEEAAEREASQAGDASPKAIRVARGEIAGAETALNDATGKQEPAGATQPSSSESVYVVVMKGSFTLSNAAIPKGASAPQGSVLALVIDAHTGLRVGRYLGEAVPDLEAVGPSVTSGSQNSR
jgi:hypothetical protein